MKRFATLFALAAVALAACQDNAPTAPGANPSTLAARGAAGLASAGPVSYPLGSVTAYEGNTGKTSAGTCPAGSLTFKQEGAKGNNDIFGYDFDVSGDGRYLSFSNVSGGYVITAVFVKGGPRFNAYTYPSPVAHDKELRSPNNDGGNVPTISHYVVCAKPVVPKPKIEKKFIGAYTGTMANMIPVDFVTMPGTPCDASKPYGGCLPIDQYATLWIKYEVTYTSPFAGTITDDLAASCSKLNSFNVDGSVFQPAFKPATFQCTTAGFYTAANPAAQGSTINVGPASDGKVFIMIDIINDGHCGDRPYTNTVTLKAGGQSISDSETVWLWPRGTEANGCNPNEGKKV